MKKGVYYKLFIGTAAFFIMDICLLFIVFLISMQIKLNILIALGLSAIFSYIAALILESIFNKNYDPDDNYNIQFMCGLIIFVIIYILMLMQT